MSTSAVSIEDEFSLESVEKTEPPEGAAAGTWYSYIIGYGQSVITGKKPGTLQTVTEHARSVVDDLNNRGNLYGSFYAWRRNK